MLWYIHIAFVAGTSSPFLLTISWDVALRPLGRPTVVPVELFKDRPLFNDVTRIARAIVVSGYLAPRLLKWIRAGRDLRRDAGYIV
jgi:hypothetical protein